jgi:predicted permease
MSWWRRKHRERDLERELQSDLELEALEQEQRGMSAKQSRIAARRALGNLTLVKEEVREAWGWRIVERLWEDLRYGSRTLRKSPAFSLAVVLTLALGIGLNTAIFSVIDTLLLKSLPVKNPEDLVVLSIRNVHAEISTTFSYPLFERLSAEQHSLSGLIAGSGADRMPVRFARGRNGEARVELVSENYFRTLGVAAKFGRTFDGRKPLSSTPQMVAVLSYGYWSGQYARSSEALGSIIRIDNVAYTIIGVMPPSFFGNIVGGAPEIWIPLPTQPFVLPGRDYIHAVSTDWLQVMARLHAGTTVRQAQADLQTIIGRLRLEPAFRRGMPEGAQIVVEPGGKGFSEIRERFERPLKILMSAVCFVLLIACVNVANLISARSATRQRELAIRLSLGASWWRVLRLMLVENLLLSCFGGVAGVLLAIPSTNALLPLLAERGSTSLTVHPDGRMLAFTSMICIFAALFFSLQSASGIGSNRKLPALKDSIAGAPKRAATRKLFVVLQVALSLVLVSGAAGLVQSLLNLRRLDPGFSKDHVLFLRIDPTGAGYKGARTAILNRRLLDDVRAVPGVVSASMSSIPLTEGKDQTCCIQVPGYTPSPNERMVIRTLDVVPGYFSTLGMTLVAGRDLADSDGRSEPKSVAVNERFVSRYFKRSTGAVGSTFQFDSKHVMQIVGVVRDARYDGIRQDVPPMVFFPTPGYEGTLLSLEVRTAVDPNTMEAQIRNAVERADPLLPVREMVSVKSLIDDSLAQERLLARLSGLFGLLGLGIAAVGLYGLMSYTVSKRINEIGIRMALGAVRRQIAGMIFREALALLLFGSAIGLVGSLAAFRVLSAFWFGMGRTASSELLLSITILFFVGVFAGFFPALRATRVEPVSALRHE